MVHYRTYIALVRQDLHFRHTNEVFIRLKHLFQGYKISFCMGPGVEELMLQSVVRLHNLWSKVVLFNENISAYVPCLIIKARQFVLY